MTYFDVLESVGAGPASEVTVAAPQLLANDVHSLSSQTKPLTPQRSGAPVFSCERWLRVRFAPPFGLIGNVRIWTPSSSLSDKWIVNFGSSPVYSAPSTSPSAYATSPLPLSDPGVSNVLGGVTVNADDQHAYTSWLIFQAILTGSVADVSEQNLTFELKWVES